MHIPTQYLAKLIDGIYNKNSNLGHRTGQANAVRGIWKYVLFNPTITPPKRSAIGRSTKQAKRRREERASETSEQKKTRQERDRVHTALARSLETNEQRQARQQRNRNHSTQTRRTIHTDLNLCGFNYNPLYSYSLHTSVIIGKMDKKCTYCGAQKFKNETPVLCRWKSKVTGLAFTT
ncbi:uncharacterized protein TNCV_1484381 [Trichonephila clavipes]|nr:uncharacterized protein TNCV_1484381 [Trichonephila clavipes]